MSNLSKRLVVILIILLVAILSFGLGYVIGVESSQAPIIIETAN